MRAAQARLTVERRGDRRDKPLIAFTQRTE
jgi:hypothetical protein